MRGLLLALGVLAIVGLASSAQGGGVPSWTLQLHVTRWVAPSSFAASVTRQSTGLRVRRGLPVTLRLDRRTRCEERDAAGSLTPIRCAGIRPRLAAQGPLDVLATGQFETGRLGAIGFRARTVTLR